MRVKQIKGLNLKEITDLCISNNFTEFRAKQIYHWMYRHGVSSIDQMNNIPSKIKKMISDNFILNTLEISNIQKSNVEDTIKFLFKTHDNYFIESVSMIDKNLHTVCISSQIGCTLNCDFCDTGKMGLFRNLSPGEIIDQLIFVRKEIYIWNIRYDPREFRYFK